ncbi:hypothetical protein OJ997_25270 [Solirubrobacter phytolaccae]|uniref:Uncharacterized protein n=1 Tax=Solirubrobacter phytolaccae TaxID=1404360 RepID=A0A9X3NCK8_9ACTN|nr:hypothetical protein [Solirubrobacter phytolaccae]MDA0183644.1 hypothetical protein [Solirubrobacter phytolaccae]
MHAVLRFAADAKAADGLEQQIYARQIVGQLRLIHLCAGMLAKELTRLGIDQGHRDRLQDGITAFAQALPGAKDARDIREHLDEYARGEGQLQRRAMRESAIDRLAAAARFWGGGYDPLTEEFREGPFVVSIPVAVEAARLLQTAIYHAARAVDASRDPARRSNPPSEGNCS